MTLLNPLFLQVGLALTLLILVGFWAHARRRRKLAEFLGGRRAVDRLSPSDLLRVRIERMLLLAVGGLAAALASAEPRRSAALLEPEPSAPPPKEVVLAIDVSASMQASDVLPTRLAGAVEVARQLIDVLEEQRVGLLLYAGTGYPIAPPTLDHQALQFLLTGVVPTIATTTDPGSLLSVAIREGVALLDRSPGSALGRAESGDGTPTSHDPLAPPSRTAAERVLVLIGDGEAGEPSEVVDEAVAVAKEADVTIYTVGVGTAAGGRMIMPAGRYQLGGAVVDSNGERVTSFLQEQRLREIATAGGGRYATVGEAVGFQLLIAALEDPGEAPEVVADDRVPLWARYDLVRVLGTVALSLLLFESLLDVFPVTRGYQRARRAARRRMIA